MKRFNKVKLGILFISSIMLFTSCKSLFEKNDYEILLVLEDAKGFKNVSTIWADAEKEKGTKLKDGLLDIVLLSNVLFQTDDDRGLFREVRRILKPGGKCIVIDWTDSFSGMGPHRHHVYTKGQALSRSHETGFSLVSEFTPGAHHYGLILRA